MGSQVSVQTEEFDPVQYQGVWYEIARYPNFFQRNCTSSIAEYEWDNKRNRMNIKNTCQTKDGEIDIKGFATQDDDGDSYHLVVKFERGFVGQYWIIWTDYDKWALVGNENKNNFWILSRTERISSSDFDLLKSRAYLDDYFEDKLIITKGAIITKDTYQ